MPKEVEKVTCTAARCFLHGGKSVDIATDLELDEDLAFRLERQGKVAIEESARKAVKDHAKTAAKTSGK